MTNMHEVPSYFNFYLNNTTLELLIESITSLGNVQHTCLQQTCQDSLQNGWSIRPIRVRDERLNVKDFVARHKG